MVSVFIYVYDVHFAVGNESARYELAGGSAALSLNWKTRMLAQN